MAGVNQTIDVLGHGCDCIVGVGAGLGTLVLDYWEFALGVGFVAGFAIVLLAILDRVSDWTVLTKTGAKLMSSAERSKNCRPRLQNSVIMARPWSTRPVCRRLTC